MKALRVIAIVGVVAVVSLLVLQGRKLGEPGPHEGGCAMGLRGRLWIYLAALPRGPLGWISAWGMTKMHMFDRAMAPELDLQPDDELLDVGCGPGGLLLDHAAHVRFVAGLDHSEIQVAMARRRLAERVSAGTAEIMLGDAAALPWAEGRFSVVTSINTLKFVPDPEGALHEIHRVLHPGGRAVLTLGEAEQPPAGSPESYVNALGERQWSDAAAQRVMEEAGFIDVAISVLPVFSKAKLVRGTKPAVVESSVETTESPEAVAT